MTAELVVKTAFDSRVLANLIYDSEDILQQKLQNAHRSLDEYPQGLPLYQRQSILQALSDRMQANIEHLTNLIVQEGGKPRKDALIEVNRAIHTVNLAVHLISSDVMAGQQIPMDLSSAGQGHIAFTRQQPCGVVLAISAFNHPLNMAVHQIVTAIAAGCAVLIKPDLRTPLCCLWLVEALQAIGLPQGWCQLLLCSNQQAQMLASSTRIHFLNFIGSSKIGWLLRSQLAPGVQCLLEHGGAAPAILDQGIDDDSLIDGLLRAGFYHAGQVCISTQRVFVVGQKRAEDMAHKLAMQAEQLVVGDPSDDKTDVGCLMTAASVRRVDQYVQAAINGGALCLTGGKPLSDNLYAPTILLNPPAECFLSRQEAFAPVLVIYGCHTMTEAIARANDTDFIFQASIFSNDLANLFAYVDALQATSVLINQHTTFRTDWMPFEGRGQSGQGVSGVGYVMRALQNRKLVVMKA